jgi:hypothetical protein
MTRSHLSLAFYLSLVFLSGLCAGALGYRLYNTEATAKAKVAKDRKPTPDEWRARFVETLTKRLELSDSQLLELHTILDRTKHRFDALEKESDELFHPRKRALIEQQTQEISAILDNEQKIEFQALRAERAERRRKAREKRGESKAE